MGISSIFVAFLENLNFMIGLVMTTNLSQLKIAQLRSKNKRTLCREFLKNIFFINIGLGEQILFLTLLMTFNHFIL